MIHCEASVAISRLPTVVFAFVDDVTKAPQWLGMCQSLELVSPTPKRKGSELRYLYKEGRGTKEMVGTVTAHDPQGRLEMTLSDAMFEIAITFRVEPAAGGSRFELVFDITPKKFAAKLMAPMIRGMTQKQVLKDTVKLKSLLESGAD